MTIVAANSRVQLGICRNSDQMYQAWSHRVDIESHNIKKLRTWERVLQTIEKTHHSTDSIKEAVYCRNCQESYQGRQKGTEKIFDEILFYHWIRKEKI